MTRVRLDLFTSLDGYTPADPTPENPMGADRGRLTAAYASTRTAPRPPISMDGGTTFHFRNAAIEDVLAEATQATGGLDVRVGGGYSTARDFLRAGLVDDLHLMVAPIFLGRGNRLWDDLRGFELTHKVTTEVAESGEIHVTLTR
jgi:dihydrofolate reductase